MSAVKKNIVEQNMSHITYTKAFRRYLLFKSNNHSNAFAKFVTRHLIGQRQKTLQYNVGYSLTSFITFHVMMHGFILLATIQFEAKLRNAIEWG